MLQMTTRYGQPRISADWETHSACPMSWAVPEIWQNWIPRVREELAAISRSKPVQLTKPGKTIVERTMTKVLASDEKLLTVGLDVTEIASLTGLIAKFLSALEPTEDKRQGVRRKAT